MSMFKEQLNYVVDFFTKRGIPFDMEPTRWGHVVTAECVRINFNKNTVNTYRKIVVSPAGTLDWDWFEQLHAPGSASETLLFNDHIRLMCAMAHYAHMAREFTKAPDWIMFIVGAEQEKVKPADWRIRVGAYVRLNHLGADTYYKFLAGQSYYSANVNFHDDQSDRMSARDFNDMTLALGSPVGQSYTDGHMPEAHGNFLEDGPFTFVPAKATISTKSDYVLPQVEPETWPIWILVRTHDVKMEAGKPSEKA